MMGIIDPGHGPPGRTPSRLASERRGMCFSFSLLQNIIVVIVIVVQAVVGRVRWHCPRTPGGQAGMEPPSIFRMFVGCKEERIMRTVRSLLVRGYSFPDPPRHLYYDD
jgi:hypothetical protein